LSIGAQNLEEESVALPGRKLSRQIDISRGVRSVDLEVSYFRIQSQGL
jgi:hypothetical protein